MHAAGKDKYKMHQIICLYIPGKANAYVTDKNKYIPGKSKYNTRV